jgi:hypothetical protein
MSGCDTLIVENGYYYDNVNMPSNTAGNVSGSECYTTIEAATPWGVTIDSSHVTPSPNAVVFIAQPYIQVIGIKAASNPDDAGAGGANYPWMVINTNHVKLQQTAGYNAPCATSAGSNWNMDVYAIGPGSSYVLVEDSHAWGCGRYKFMSYQSDHVIFRRDVARHDFAGDGYKTNGATLEPMNQCGDFVNYDGQYTIFQNDIAIDSGDAAADTGFMYGALWSEHHLESIDNVLTFEGSVIDNVQGGSASWQDTRQSGLHTFINDASVNSNAGLFMGPDIVTSAVTSVTFGTTMATIVSNNQVAAGYSGVFSGLTGNAAVLNGQWFTVSATGLSSTQFEVPYSAATPGGPYAQNGTFGWIVGQTPPTTKVSHLTIANLLNTSSSYTDDANGATGIGLEGIVPFYYYTSQSVSNSILQNINSTGAINTYAASDWINSDYNYYYENNTDFGSTVYGGYTPTAGANDVQGVNPQIKYITREETGTPVYGTASDGGNIGATILYEIGTTGTLYGDPGYDTITTTSLWPFPNEAVIKSDMATFSMTNPITGNLIDGTRGFAAPGNGLYGGPITLTSYIWEALGYPCPAGICP